MTSAESDPEMAPARQFLRVAISDGVLRVSIDRAEKRNALSRAVLGEIEAVFRRQAADDTLRFGVLTAAGDRSFAAGGDLSDLADVKGAEAARKMALDAKAALNAIREFPVPIIAALNGDALGGGAELAMACDMRIALHHVRIGFIQGKLAISPAWGGGVDLIHQIGPARALELLARCEMVEARRAVELGLLNAVGEESEDLEALIERFVAPMRVLAPQVMRTFKALARSGHNEKRAAEDEAETRLFAQNWAHPDHDAAVQRLFNRSRT